MGKYSNIKSMLKFFMTHHDCIGARHEFAICKAVRGHVSHCDDFDILAENGARIEVKFSKLSKTRSEGRKYRRPEDLSGQWDWGKINGITNKKQYDYLILVGEQAQIKNAIFPNEKYAYFVLSKADAYQFLGKNRSTRRISLHENKKTVCANKQLYNFIRTISDIRRQFRRPAG